MLGQGHDKALRYTSGKEHRHFLQRKDSLVVNEVPLLGHGPLNNGQTSHPPALLAACFGAVYKSDNGGQ